jgi:hypothetical protein
MAETTFSTGSYSTRWPRERYHSQVKDRKGGITAAIAKEMGPCRIRTGA